MLEAFPPAAQVNNAGIGGKQGKEALMENISMEDFDHVISVSAAGGSVPKCYTAT